MEKDGSGSPRPGPVGKSSSPGRDQQSIPSLGVLLNISGPGFGLLCPLYLDLEQGKQKRTEKKKKLRGPQERRGTSRAEPSRPRAAPPPLLLHISASSIIVIAHPGCRPPPPGAPPGTRTSLLGFCSRSEGFLNDGR